ncbi:MAG TPA: sigma-54 dependent transcriptional regulator [Marinobacter sp.]|nr:sigma-54 dependent transcriptional regulator [Marinobacter sp.]
MEAKRPLVWLSADDPIGITAVPLEQRWHLNPINSAHPPAPVPPDSRHHPVGICDLTGLQPGQLENVRLWLELLPVRYWLALVLPGQPALPAVQRLIQDYCQDYHTAPADWERLHNSLGHLWGMSCLPTADPSARPSDYQAFALEGPSDAVRRTRSLLRRFATTREPILIYGESGTGREAAAHFIHKSSPRQHRPLITLNCAALPLSLTQSELFGHERGAFTHALRARKGRLEAADGGTLVLLGADELSLDQQSTLLRFLQEGQIEPVGSGRTIQLDVRIIAICSTPLEELVQQQRFREDVYYRLGNLSVTLPPLRQRLEDLPYQTRRVLESRPGTEHHTDNRTLLAMALYDWPGNLRELQNRLGQACLLARHPQLSPADLGLPTPGGLEQHEQFSLELCRARADQQAISTSLSLTRHNISAAARLLRISRVSLYRLMDKYHLQPPAAHHTNPSYPPQKGDAP